MGLRIDHASRRSVSFRYGQLLMVLLCFHIASPLVQVISPALAMAVLVPLYILLLGGATLAMSSTRRKLVVGVLAMPALVVATVSLFAPEAQPLLLSASTLPFLSFAAAMIFLSVLEPGVIDRARLLGTACVFILLAQVWSALYTLLELLSPGSFAASHSEPVRVGDLAYLSLVTQTTLGFGDVVPESPLARSLVTLQATTGLFYMGVIVARFAGRLQLTAPLEVHCDGSE